MRPANYGVRDGHLVFPEVAVPENTVIHGDCIAVMAGLPAASVDFVLTDPPYICNYRDRQGRTIANDTNVDRLEPACRAIHRLVKPAGHAVHQLLRLDRHRSITVGVGCRRVQGALVTLSSTRTIRPVESGLKRSTNYLHVLSLGELVPDSAMVRGQCSS
ncbi:hypothetical protein [Agrobacterium bohemicum]|uniref:DNA methylase N-4/N-6 domain-containing protein n=1 Tax=Agrobacterium bohemicum TaxID=2052828 RepID=A0A135P8B9_9HYPH|nr:hypothetical protein [Agrobacterium bohemicum]KXG87598.1 hypothetical protein ATO67_18295 [Agrobacterium bohemicum]